MLPYAQGARSLNRLKLVAAGLFLCTSTAAAGAGAEDGQTRHFAASARTRLAHRTELDLSTPQLTNARRQALDAVQPRSLGGMRHAIDVSRTTADRSDVDRDVKSFANAAFTIRWQSRPEFERVVRKFRRNGLPIVRLWESGRGLLAIGLSPRGVPGIYFTQKVPD